MKTNLLKRPRAIDKAELEKTFKTHSKALYYYATKFVDNETARDIVQDIFISLWSKSNIEISKSLHTYLFQMVKNRSLNIIEKNIVRQKHAESRILEIKRYNLLSDNYDPLRNLLTKELSEKLNKAIDKLPENCAQIFKLSRYEKKKNREIAEELQISIKTVEKNITKALKFLKSELKDYMPLIIYLICNK